MLIYKVHVGFFQYKKGERFLNMGGLNDSAIYMYMSLPDSPYVHYVLYYMQFNYIYIVICLPVKNTNVFVIILWGKSYIVK